MRKELNVATHIKDIVRRLNEAGYETYIVGGAIRDLLLNRIPKDYDISTAARPEQVKEVFGRKRTMIIGKRFRLVHLYHGEEIIEISTFRQAPQAAGVRFDGRVQPENQPEKMIFSDNQYGTAEEDARRRDFTVNALFYNPENCEIIDYTGSGVDDIKTGTVKVIGDPIVRFEEDPVRLLRALKLVGQYGFRMEQFTEEALFKQMPLIIHASSSRMTLELEKIMKGVHSHKILPVFQRYGFLKYFLPYLDKNWHTKSADYAIRLLEGRNRRVSERAFRDSISIAMAALALPFIEHRSGCDSGALWEFQPRTPGLINQVIREVFMPHVLVKRLLIAAERMLYLQTALVNSSKVSRIIDMSGYIHARELMMIQNVVEWHLDNLDKKWPEQPAIKVKRNRRGDNRHRSRLRPDIKTPAV
ncbi:MAG: hypothetical protein PHV75_01750 [Victivallaceae bacterium]|nr:hypothetical protein [Victivallaceae bacterium]MDD3703933.1 hypothetical protein [Victivallaceae bacterium]MDD4317221.1 hypothetical protein [Victivallaceae bacterium]MDD5664510.1 hypothetical protein [Victivallaceae bacterium]NLK83761.1 hypothetical protein [Lentisphaerota bacterium]